MRPVLPIVTRAREDALLRACRPGEAPCIRGAQCRGVHMPDGYILPRMDPWSECVLCLRAHATAAWLACLGGTAEAIIPLYRNRIGPGEYAHEATLQPVGARFDGLTDPMVRFCPDRLKWDGERLDQSSLHYRLCPSLRHPARPPTQATMPNGLVDVFRNICASGLFGCKGADTISTSMQRALWSRDPMLDVTSTWLRALVAHYFPGQTQTAHREAMQAAFDALPKPTLRSLLLKADMALAAADAAERELAALAVRRRIVEHAQGNAVLEQALAARHGQWHEYSRLVLACPGTPASIVQLKRELKQRAPLRMNQESIEARVARLGKRGATGVTDMEACKRLHALDEKDRALIPFIGAAAPGLFFLPAPDHWPAHADVGLQYVCMQCQNYKGALLQARRSPDEKPLMQGQRDMAYSLETGKLNCYKKRNNRKGDKERVVCDELRPVRIGGRVIELFGVCHVPCVRCGVLAPRTSIDNAFTCGLCEETPKPVCEVCQEPRTWMFSVNVFEDSCRQGVHTIRLCKKHHKGFVADHTIWAKRPLMRRVLQDDKEAANRRVTLAVHR